MNKFVNMLKSEDGATAIEYALIAALVSIIAIVAMSSVGTEVNSSFSNVASSLSSANSE